MADIERRACAFGSLDPGDVLVARARPNGAHDGRGATVNPEHVEVFESVGDEFGEFTAHGWVDEGRRDDGGESRGCDASRR